MNILWSAICAVLALVFYNRVRSLQFTKNDIAFVLLQIVTTTICIYCSYSFWYNGVGVLKCMAFIQSVLYLYRSHSKFLDEKHFKPTTILDDKAIRRIFKEKKYK